jgi:signal transduction histidine kinase
MRAVRIHHTVKLGYVIRLSLYPLTALILYMVFLGAGRGSWGLVAALAVYGLVWPHVAYAWASRSRGTRRAELRNLLLDALFIGGWAAWLHFSLWPATMLASGVLAGLLSVGGVGMALPGVLAMVAGVIVVGTATGFAVDLETSLVPTLLCIGGILLYMGVFSHQAYVQNLRIVRSRKALVARHREVQEQRGLLVAAKEEAEAAREEAEAANRAKGQFLANMSHELRTPLSSIIGYSEMLLEKAEASGFGGAAPGLEKIRRAAWHLQGLINGVLDMSKIEAGRMEVAPEPVDVGMLVEEVVTTARPLVERNGNRLAVVHEVEPGVILTDGMRLRQVLLNLLSNAGKFTLGGDVTLAVGRVGSGASERVVFRVSDTGIGMTEAQLGRIFRPYVQAEPQISSKYGGTGLGLFLSRRFCLLLGGDIEVASQPGLGSVFTVTVPVSLRPASRTGGRAPADGRVVVDRPAPAGGGDPAARGEGARGEAAAPVREVGGRG